MVFVFDRFVLGIVIIWFVWFNSFVCGGLFG